MAVGLGMVERKGNVVAKRIDTAKTKEIVPVILDNAKPGAKLMTDEYYAYGAMGKIYDHQTIKHILKKYVVGEIHTNTIENFWSCLKRGLYGIYHFVDRYHLQKYLDEFCFRYNLRNSGQQLRFNIVLASGCGTDLPYKQLIKPKK